LTLAFTIRNALFVGLRRTLRSRGQPRLKSLLARSGDGFGITGAPKPRNLRHAAGGRAPIGRRVRPFLPASHRSRFVEANFPLALHRREPCPTSPNSFCVSATKRHVSALFRWHWQASAPSPSATNGVPNGRDWIEPVSLNNPRITLGCCPPATDLTRALFNELRPVALIGSSILRILLRPNTAIPSQLHSGPFHHSRSAALAIARAMIRVTFHSRAACAAQPQGGSEIGRTDPVCTLRLRGGREIARTAPDLNGVSGTNRRSELAGCPAPHLNRFVCNELRFSQSAIPHFTDLLMFLLERIALVREPSDRDRSNLQTPVFARWRPPPAGG
jgi:hypothetical protein